MYVIGRGRYARETYDKPSQSAAFTLLSGYDCVVEDLALVSGADDAQFPRTPAGTPLQVVVPVNAGDVLEIDWSFCFINASAVAASIARFSSIVSFDPAPVFPADFSLVNPSGGGITVPIVTLSGAERMHTRQISAVTCPSSGDATVQVMYTFNADGGTLGVDGLKGSTEGRTSGWLVVRVVPPALVGQPPPSVLVPL